MNPAIKDITIQDLRQINGFEKYSDKELLKFVEGIKELTLLLNLVPSADPLLKK